MQVYTYKQNALTRQKVQPMHDSSIRGVEDMATLEDLHDGAIMHNLFLRYQQRQIYVSLYQLARPLCPVKLVKVLEFTIRIGNNFLENTNHMFRFCFHTNSHFI